MFFVRELIPDSGRGVGLPLCAPAMATVLLALVTTSTSTRDIQTFKLSLVLGLDDQDDPGPAGLSGADDVRSGDVAEKARIGVDIGPNLSVTGSPATNLWLSAPRRENLRVSAWMFLKRGALVMPPALFPPLTGALVAP